MALELLTEGETFTVSDDQLSGVTNSDPEAKYIVRRLDPKTHRKMTKSHTKREFVRGVGPVDKIDGAALSDDIMDYIVTGWSGVLFKGEPAPCTREMKLSGLDYHRRVALMDLAGMNEITSAPERRAESFRPPQTDV